MNNEPQKKKNVVIKRRRIQSSPHQNADATTTMQVSRKFDWILLVEGAADVKFYKRFTSSFREFDREKSIIKEFEDESKELIRQRTNELVNKEADPKKQKKLKNNLQKTNRQKIIRLIEEKIKDKERNHFYGIMDYDYGRPNADKSIWNNIKYACPNSLETMLVYKLVYNAGLVEFSKIIDFKGKLSDDSSKKNFISSAILFAFKIGILRKLSYNKKLGCKFDFIADYSPYIELITDDSNVVKHFNFLIEKYLDDFLSNQNNTFDYSKEDLITEIRNKTNELYKDGEITFEIYKYCQGHDIIRFIKVFLTKIGEYPDFNIGNYIINNYPTECFIKSEINCWLKKIENLKENEEKSLTEPKYRDYIVSVGK